MSPGLALTSADGRWTLAMIPFPYYKLTVQAVPQPSEAEPLPNRVILSGNNSRDLPDKRCSDR